MSTEISINKIIIIESIEADNMDRNSTAPIQRLSPTSTFKQYQLLDNDVREHICCNTALLKHLDGYEDKIEKIRLNSALEMLSDTERAILEFGSNREIGYLELYGFFNAIQMHQEALFTIKRVIFIENKSEPYLPIPATKLKNLKAAFFNLSPEVDKLRTLRNNVAGHPNDSGGACNFVNRYSINSAGFKLETFKKTASAESSEALPISAPYSSETTKYQFQDLKCQHWASALVLLNDIHDCILSEFGDERNIIRVKGGYHHERKIDENGLEYFTITHKLN